MTVLAEAICEPLITAHHTPFSARAHLRVSPAALPPHADAVAPTHCPGTPTATTVDDPRAGAVGIFSTRQEPAT